MKKSIKTLYLGLLLLCLFAGQPLLALAEASYGVDSWLVNTNDLRKKASDLGSEAVKNLPLPVLIGVSVSELVPDFGDPRPGGRKHQGLDIMAPMGSPIVSPTDAVVLKAGFGESAGYYVYTANPGGEIFAYMHLQENSPLQAGDELEEGDLIGYVGNTGNAKGSSPHLHFEVRKNGPTDPFSRLTKEFGVEEKVAFLQEIVGKVKDTSVAVSRSVKTVLAKDEGTEDNAINMPNTDLKLGARGNEVKELQKFLIEQNVGTSVVKLAKAGATGYFGEVTKQALAEYQASVGIKPASGYYGRLTRSHIASNI